MKLIKTVLCLAILLTMLVTAPFSAELPAIHIAVLEDPTLVATTPFASRVQIFAPSQSEKDEEYMEHGVAVCSVLVGTNSPLPEYTPVTVVPTIDLFSSYLKDKSPQDLVILNWSGCTGYPGLSEEVLEGLENIQEHFNTILRMDETAFTLQFNDYIKAYDNMLAQLPQNNPLTGLLCYAKECLLIGAKQLERTEEDKKTWSSGVSEKIEVFKNHAEDQVKLRFSEMKAKLLEALTQHDNTLIVWALGNEGAAIDNDPFWQGLLSNETILDHTLLVHGTTLQGKIHIDSSFTNIYLHHSVGKPFKVPTWNINKLRYVQDMGTSLSAPLATIDAYIEAKKKIDQTGQVPTYKYIKQSLLGK